MKLRVQASMTAITPIALLLGTVLVLAATAPRRAYADAQQLQSFSVWRQMADCARLAAKQYPDHTPEGNAKREEARQNCLRQRHLPVTAAPPPPAAQ
jgi:hypothetical protein